ncbi:hypothetical protein C0Q70_21299 [Pomacea canaliculata]|uniref:Ionotropic glutamate receptor C-terminal domain-containing protein n=1 Tax=Pomacea canaliculata TaxID=400727 RepID=A0A2T7NC55_POMCA|nr:hypothetical protein C0Q70_21299 [Pomacea canaliculata]
MGSSDDEIILQESFMMGLVRLKVYPGYYKEKGNNTCPDPSKTIESITHLRVGVLLDPPYVQRSPNTVNHYEGVFIDVLNELCQRVGMTFTITGNEDLYGYQQDDGNWTGLIGSLARNETDLAVAPLTITSGREKTIDFTHPVLYAGLRILYKIPSSWTEGEPFALMLTPFTVGLWIMVLLMFIAVSVLFYVIGRFSPYEDHAFVGKAATYEGLTLVNSFLYVFSSLSSKVGYTAAPRSMSGRVLAAFWWMFTMLVIAAYTASLAAIFLAMKPSVKTLPFATFDELSKQNEVAYGIVKNGSTMRYLQKSNRPLQKRLWGTINANLNKVATASINEGVKRVIEGDGKYAFIMEGPMAEHLAQQAAMFSDGHWRALNEHAFGFACRSQTDVCTKLNHAILELHEEDFIYEYVAAEVDERRLSVQRPSRVCLPRSALLRQLRRHSGLLCLRTVTLRRFSIGFLLIFIGICVSAFVLVAESLSLSDVEQRYLNGYHVAEMTSSRLRGTFETRRQSGGIDADACKSVRCANVARVVV